MNIREKIIEILSSNSDIDNTIQYLHRNDDLTQLEMNSISFIKTVIMLESEFGFVFDDEALDYNKFTSLNLLCDYVEHMIKENDSI